MTQPRGSGTPAKPQPSRTVKAVPPHNPTPSAREVGDRARLAEEVRASLDKVRATAENWRTGMAGTVTLVTAVLVFKGKNSIADYRDWVRYVMGGLTASALILSIASPLLFLSAAHGRLRPVSAQAVLDQGGVDVRNVHLATSAIGDLRWARRLAIGGAVLLAAALVLSWYGPAAPTSPPAFVRIAFRDAPAHPAESLCGELKAQDGVVTVVQVTGEPGPRRVPTGTLVSVVVVPNC
jgi:hypothetical protein